MSAGRGRFDRYLGEHDITQIHDSMRRMNHIIRVGSVDEVDVKVGRVRVKMGSLTTTWLKWCTARAGEDKNWNPPSKGEQVVLLCPSGRLEQAIVLGALYSKSNDSPANKAEHRRYIAKDGTDTFQDMEKKTHQVFHPKEGSHLRQVDKVAASITKDGHTLKHGDKVFVVIEKDKIHLHAEGNGIIIDKEGIKIESKKLTLPPKVYADQIEPKAGKEKNEKPKDHTPKDGRPKGDTGTSTYEKVKKKSQ